MKGKVIEEPQTEEIEGDDKKLTENSKKTVKFDIQPEQEIEKFASGKFNRIPYKNLYNVYLAFSSKCNQTFC